MEGQTHFHTPLTWYRMFFIQTSTPTISIDWKLTKHRLEFCMQNNQLPTKTHGEVKNNSVGQEVKMYNSASYWIYTHAKFRLQKLLAFSTYIR